MTTSRSRPSSGSSSNSKLYTDRSRSRSASIYKSAKAVKRSRGGSFDVSRSTTAQSARSSVGRVRMRSGSAATAQPRIRATLEGGHRWSGEFGYAKRENIVNNYNIVNIYNNNVYVNRSHLYDYGGRWGHCPTYYTGRNYHFYITLCNQGYFGVGVRIWNRRYYGDGWDFHFGWSPSHYFVSGWYSRGSYYFEPCYAFSFTFNHGYEQGYIDGYRQGTSDWNYNYPYRDWLGTYNGYYSYWGSWSEYADGYEQGFRQGYYAGYCGYSYGYQNFGFGDFSNYPVIYDYDYDYYDNQEAAYYDDGFYDDGHYDDDYYDDDYDYDYNVEVSSRYGATKEF